jgi:hypothetical protein
LINKPIVAHQSIFYGIKSRKSMRDLKRRNATWVVLLQSAAGSANGEEGALAVERGKGILEYVPATMVYRIVIPYFRSGEQVGLAEYCHEKKAFDR